MTGFLRSGFPANARQENSPARVRRLAEAGSPDYFLENYIDHRGRKGRVRASWRDRGRGGAAATRDEPKTIVDIRQNGWYIMEK